MVGTHMMTERRRRDEVVVRLERPGRTVVALTSMQIANFAGTALELQGRDGRRILALSIDGGFAQYQGSYAEYKGCR
jgi:hypothetical protein